MDFDGARFLEELNSSPEIEKIKEELIENNDEGIQKAKKLKSNSQIRYNIATEILSSVIKQLNQLMNKKRSN